MGLKRSGGFMISLILSAGFIFPQLFSSMAKPGVQPQPSDVVEYQLPTIVNVSVNSDGSVSLLGPDSVIAKDTATLQASR